MQIQNSACKVFVLKTRKSLSMVKISTSIDLQYCKTDPFCNQFLSLINSTTWILQIMVAQFFPKILMARVLKYEPHLHIQCDVLKNKFRSLTRITIRKYYFL